VAFVLGMMLVVGPYACRNYRLTGRLVLVNAEGWMALWGSTAADLGIHPNHYNWSLLYPTHFMPIFTRVTGSPVYSRHAFIESNLALEDAFRKEALSNLWSRPGVYARNVLGSFVAFNTRINSVFIKAFQAVQDRRTYSRQEWFAVGNSQDFHGPLGADLFSTFASGLTLLAGAGLVLALRGREEWVLAPLVVYASLCVAHSLVYMDLMYYYVRIPFLVVFAARLFAPARPESALARRVAAVISAAVPALSFALWPFVL
jgi:hypothetical protein